MSTKVRRIVAVAWRSKTGDHLHLGTDNTHPRCAGAEAVQVVSVGKRYTYDTQATTATLDALRDLNLALSHQEIVTAVGSDSLCGRCSARHRLPAQDQADLLWPVDLNEFQQAMPSVAEMALREAVDDERF